jgi:hypothetical protein
MPPRRWRDRRGLPIALGMASRRSNVGTRPGCQPCVVSAVRRRRRLRCLWSLLVTALWLASGRSYVAAQFDDRQVKAAFVLNFLKFVVWPEESFLPAAPVVIGVMGEDELAKVLDQSAAGQSVGGRPVTVRVVAGLHDLTELPHLLFIGPSERDNLSAVLRRLEGHPVLTVGDAAGFGSSGVVLNFYVSDKRIRFEANTTAAARANLRISSHLLRIARIVG